MKPTKVFTSVLLSSLIAWPSITKCQTGSSAWIYNKTVDFYEGSTQKFQPQYKSLKLNGNHIEINPSCSIQIEEMDYAPSLPFQSLMKASVIERDINSFIKRHFNTNLQDSKIYYRNIEKSNTCNDIGLDIIISNDKMIIIDAGTLFHQYTRTFTSIIYAPDRSLVDLGNLKTSQLPFDLTDLIVNCTTKKMKFIKGVPQPTEKCGPTYYPHVSTRRSSDWLSKLIGSFNYGKNGVRHADTDYDNPVANGLHPVFLVLPPMNDVILVRVQDEEFSERRDAMSGAYLSIKEKKVVDVLSDGCDFDVSYTCSSRNSSYKFRLQPDGHFKRIQ